MDAQLTAYLARIGLDEAPATGADGLARLLAAHRQAIAFENLDIVLGRPICIDGESVAAKLVARGRGGYCFEHNRLLADMLARLGMANRPLLARVRLGMAEGMTPPRTHQLQLVDLEDGLWLADAGFGGSFVPPMPLADGAMRETADGARHRLRRMGARGGLDGEWLLERAGPQGATDGRSAPHGDWQPQYGFDLSDVAPDDLEQCNHWTSTRPGTRFTGMLVVSIVLPGGFAGLADRQLSVWKDGAAERREIVDASNLGETLRGLLRLSLADGEVDLLWQYLARQG